MSGYIGPIPVPQGIQNKETFTATAGQTTFNTNGGLIADATQASVVYPSTLDAEGNAVYTQLYGGDAIDVNDEFKAGTTITGRWTSVNINSGAIIAYIG